MRSSLLPRTIPFVFSWMLVLQTSAQSPQTDSADYTDATKQARAYYFRETGPNLLIYQGKEYLRNGEDASGYPFAFSDSLLDGSVFYDGNEYMIPVRYDLVNDVVITPDFDKKNLTVLNTAKLPAFRIGERHFIFVDQARENGRLAGPGYYQQLPVAGSMELLIKRRKKLVAPGKFEDIGKYTEDVQYFLEYNHSVFKISSENSLLNAFNDRRAELKDFIKKEGIKFNTDRESAILQIAGEYNHLKN